jgi:hypothetical protein
VSFLLSCGRTIRRALFRMSCSGRLLVWHGGSGGNRPFRNGRSHSGWPAIDAHFFGWRIAPILHPTGCTYGCGRQPRRESGNKGLFAAIRRIWRANHAMARKYPGDTSPRGGLSTNRGEGLWLFRTRKRIRSGLRHTPPRSRTPCAPLRAVGCPVQVNADVFLFRSANRRSVTGSGKLRTCFAGRFAGASHPMAFWRFVPSWLYQNTRFNSAQPGPILAQGNCPDGAPLRRLRRITGSLLTKMRPLNLRCGCSPSSRLPEVLPAGRIIPEGVRQKIRRNRILRALARHSMPNRCPPFRCNAGRCWPPSRSASREFTWAPAVAKGAGRPPRFHARLEAEITIEECHGSWITP